MDKKAEHNRQVQYGIEKDKLTTAEDAVRAEALLRNPLLNKIFQDERNEAILAFERLPLNATLEEYKTVHLGFWAMNRFQGQLQAILAKNRHQQEVELKKQQQPKDGIRPNI